jgi:hypothetical protein
MYQISSPKVERIGDAWRWLAEIPISSLQSVCTIKAFNLVGFPYNEVFGPLLGGVEFRQYMIEWFLKLW